MKKTLITLLAIFMVASIQAALPIYLGSPYTYLTNTGTRINLVHSNDVVWSIDYTNATFDAFFLPPGVRMGLGTNSPDRALTIAQGTMAIEPNGSGAILVRRRGDGTGNGQYWAIQVQNSAATDAMQLGHSSSTYTTGGSIGWLGNSESFIYAPSSSKLKFGIGAGAVPSLTLSANQVAVNTNTPESTFAFHVGNGGDLKVDDDATIGGDIDLTGNIITPLVTNTTIASVTNFVVDFNQRFAVIEAASDIHFSHTTNRTDGDWKSSVVKVIAGGSDRSISVNTNWTAFGSTTNRFTLSANRVCILSVGQDGSAESNVSFVANTNSVAPGQ